MDLPASPVELAEYRPEVVGVVLSTRFVGKPEVEVQLMIVSVALS